MSSAEGGKQPDYHLRHHQHLTTPHAGNIGINKGAEFEGDWPDFSGTTGVIATDNVQPRFREIDREKPSVETLENEHCKMLEKYALKHTAVYKFVCD